jgi:hypothetical protein
VDHLAGLVGERGQHARVCVAERVYAQAAHQVEVLVAIHVEEQAALPAFHHNGVAGVDRDEVLGIAGEDLAGGLVCGGVAPKMFHTTSSPHRNLSVKSAGEINPAQSRKLMRYRDVSSRTPRVCTAIPCSGRYMISSNFGL